MFPSTCTCPVIKMKADELICICIFIHNKACCLFSLDRIDIDPRFNYDCE